MASPALSTSSTSLYLALQVTKNSSAEEIKKSYRRLALMYHPDKNSNNAEATEKFKQINYAYSVLSNPVKRNIYDKYGKFGLHLGEQFGDENVNQILCFASSWFLVLATVCGVLTCCYCCCCCFCCCNFCCGKYKRPAGQNSGEYERLREHAVTDAPVVEQPSARTLT